MTSQQIEAHKLRQAEAAKEFISKRVPLQIDPIIYKIGQDNLINAEIPTNTEGRVKKAIFNTIEGILQGRLK